MKQYESLQEAYKKEFDGLQFADNFRAANPKSSEELIAYAKAMEAGCCGRYDTVVMIAKEVMLGDKWHKWYEPHLLGCNYGH